MVLEQRTKNKFAECTTYLLITGIPLRKVIFWFAWSQSIHIFMCHAAIPSLFRTFNFCSFEYMFWNLSVKDNILHTYIYILRINPCNLTFRKKFIVHMNENEDNGKRYIYETFFTPPVTATHKVGRKRPAILPRILPSLNQYL